MHLHVAKKETALAACSPSFPRLASQVPMRLLTSVCVSCGHRSLPRGQFLRVSHVTFVAATCVFGNLIGLRAQTVLPPALTSQYTRPDRPNSQAPSQGSHTPQTTGAQSTDHGYGVQRTLMQHVPLVPFSRTSHALCQAVPRTSRALRSPNKIISSNFFLPLYSHSTLTTI